MADRSISVRVSANVGGYLTSMQAAAAATREFGSTTLAASAKNEASLARVGKAATIGGGLVVAGLLEAAKASAEFDAKMSLVKANIDDASVPSMKRLSDAALKAGQTTVYSASEAADAEGELAKAGIKSAQITGGALTAALNLASAGQIGLGDAAEYVASTMTQFNLTAKDAGHIADDLAAGADKSLGGVQDLAEALKYAGVPASQFGISLDETVGVLAEFASNGIMGSMAGTSLRQMLLSLASPTNQAAATMKEYGINVFDAQGKFIGLAGTAKQLHDKLGGLSQQEQQAALSTIFTARAVSTANILMKGGAKDVEQWTKAVNDQGFAADQASTKLDNLAGDAKKLKNSLQVDLIKAGHDVTPVLRSLAQHATEVAQGFSNLPAPLREAIEIMGGGAGVITAFGGAAAIALPKLKKFSVAVRALAPEGTLLASALGALGPAAAIGAAGIVAAIPIYNAISGAFKEGKKEVTSFSDAIKKDGGAFGENTRQLVAHNLQQDKVLDLARKAGISLPTVTDAVLGNAKAMKELKAATEQNGKAGSEALGVYNDAVYWHKKVAAAEQESKAAAKSNTEAHKNEKDALGDSATAAQKAAAEQKKLVQAQKDFAKAHKSDPAVILAAALAGIGPNAAASANQITNLSTALDAFDDLAFGTADAAAAAGDALASMAKAGAKGASVSQILSGDLLRSNDATRQLAGNLSTVGQQYAKQLEQVFKDTYATKGNNAAIIELNKTHGEQVKALQATLAKMGITGKAADSLIAKYAGIPKNISTDVTLARVAEAKSAADSVKKSISSIPKQHTTVTQAQISELQRKLDIARRDIANVPASKRVDVTADIASAQFQLNLLRSTLAGIQSKSVTVTTYLQTQERTFGGRNNVRQARAGGGPVKAGQEYIVGEERPELFVPKQDGYILPQVPTHMTAATATPAAAPAFTKADLVAAVAAGVQAQPLHVTVESKLNGRVIARNTTQWQKQDFYGRGINNG